MLNKNKRKNKENNNNNNNKKAISASPLSVKKYYLAMFPTAWPIDSDQNITRPILHLNSYYE